MDRKAPPWRPVRLRWERLRDFSDSLTRQLKPLIALQVSTEQPLDTIPLTFLGSVLLDLHRLGDPRLCKDVSETYLHGLRTNPAGERPGSSLCVPQTTRGEATNPEEAFQNRLGRIIV